MWSTPWVALVPNYHFIRIVEEILGQISTDIPSHVYFQ